MNHEAQCYHLACQENRRGRHIREIPYEGGLTVRTTLRGSALIFIGQMLNPIGSTTYLLLVQSAKRHQVRPQLPVLPLVSNL